MSNEKTFGIRIVAWGAGGFFHAVTSNGMVEIDDLVDGDPRNWGKAIGDYTVQDPGKVLPHLDDNNTIILIYSQFKEQISKNISEFGQFKTVSVPDIVGRDFVIRSLPKFESEKIDYEAAESLFYERFPSGFIGDFGKLCWSDKDFIADYQRLTPENNRSFERKYVAHQLVKSLSHVPGDMVECGTYNGATAFFMAQASALSGAKRSLDIFDSFEGLSLPDTMDGKHWTAGDLAMSKDVVRATLADFENVNLYEGWIPDRFAEVEDKTYAFVHIDVDLYQPTLDSLKFFYPRTASGGVLLFDDYGFTTCPGAWKAIEEYMADKPEHVIHLPTGQGLVLRR
jgi:O-methyltransferase